MEITLTIPDGKKETIIADFKLIYNYDEAIIGMETPITEAAFAKEKLIDHVKNIHYKAERRRLNDANAEALTTARSYFNDIV